MAGAIGFGYSSVFVTAPSPENLQTLFEFVVKGLKALRFAEHTDFEVIYSPVEGQSHWIVRVNVFKTHRQVVQYIDPTENAKLAQAELCIVDEAAAIPLPLVKKLLGPYIVFLSSTVTGYEGTGRSLSLKLLNELRKKDAGSDFYVGMDVMGSRNVTP